MGRSNFLTNIFLLKNINKYSWGPLTPCSKERVKFTTLDKKAVLTKEKIKRNMLNKNAFLIVIKITVLIVIKITVFYN